MSNNEITEFIVGEFTHHSVERGDLNDQDYDDLAAIRAEYDTRARISYQGIVYRGCFP